jgi:hypothetical protein
VGTAWLSSLKRTHEEKERDGLASNTHWEALFLFLLYQMAQSLPLVGRYLEMMHMIRKGQMHGVNKGDSTGQVAFMASLFGVAA